MAFKVSYELYTHLRNLSWEVLKDANMTSLPIDIHKIADVYNLHHLVKKRNDLYTNTYSIAKEILKLYSYSKKPEACKVLTVRLMSPLIVLHDCCVNSAKEVQQMTLLPQDLAQQRYDRLIEAITKGKFELSKKERIIRMIFSDYIDSYLKTNQIP